MGFLAEAVVSTRGIRVLITDDQEEMRQLFRRVLQSMGYTCDTAINGQDCILKCEETDYDVVFLDLVMPELDGETTLRILKRQHPATDVIISSIQDDDGVIRDLFKLGATAYIVKPFTSHEIRNVMATLENRKTTAGLHLAAAC